MGGLRVHVSRPNPSFCEARVDWLGMAVTAGTIYSRAVSASLYVQRNQPDGVPPLELTGERTLPDVPEENYWYRRHLVVYQWIAARVGGLRTIDMACGEGYGSNVLAAGAASVVGVDANPRGARARAHALPARQPALRARSDRNLLRARRRRGVPADDRASAATRGRRSSTSVSWSAPAARCTSPRPTCSRSRRRGRRARTTHGTCTSTARTSSSSCAASTSPRWRCSASSTPASCARTSSPCGWAGTAVHPRLGLTERFYGWFTPAISAATSRCARDWSRCASLRRRPTC